MSDLKTRPTGQALSEWLDTVQPDRRREETRALDQLFRKVTGFAPQLWAGGMVGYGRYDYTYESGRSGTFMATGFAPRKAKLSIYILPGYADFGPILERLGKHKKGKSCLYINKLEDVDLDVLGELIVAGLKDLGTYWLVHPD
ncbi:MAG: DUF1801 domain-containing protein [Pseudomonadota bacterium]